ncbi:hypothetical protein LXA43DRAFT_1069886 [Ganoderma leucocontextum]|nr:hypothetical protein LXA43DRAFT_1069886 [Ganoderma leucocontextum]
MTRMRTSRVLITYLTAFSVAIPAKRGFSRTMPAIRFRMESSSKTRRTRSSESSQVPKLNIDPKLRAAFNGFNEPTPIQACSWPPDLEGRDVVGIAETGRPSRSAALCWSSSSCPHWTANGTTVTCEQEKLDEPFGVVSVAVYGSVDNGPQRGALKNVNMGRKTTRIVVGTPGGGNGIPSIIRNRRTIQGSKPQTVIFIRMSSGHWRLGSRPDDLTSNSRIEQVAEVFDKPHEKT